MFLDKAAIVSVTSNQMKRSVKLKKIIYFINNLDRYVFYLYLTVSRDYQKALQSCMA